MSKIGFVFLHTVLSQLEIDIKNPKIVRIKIESFVMMFSLFYNVFFAWKIVWKYRSTRNTKSRFKVWKWQFVYFLPDKISPWLCENEDSFLFFIHANQGLNFSLYFRKALKGLHLITVGVTHGWQWQVSVSPEGVELSIILFNHFVADSSRLINNLGLHPRLLMFSHFVAISFQPLIRIINSILQLIVALSFMRSTLTSHIVWMQTWKVLLFIDDHYKDLR